MYGMPEIILTNYTVDNSSLEIINYGPDKGRFIKKLLNASGTFKLSVSEEPKCVAVRIEPNGLYKIILFLLTGKNEPL